MKVVVDTNRVIASLVKESTTRSILFNKNFEFVTPDHTMAEINKHKYELKAKTSLTDVEFDVLLVLIFEHIEIIPQSEYNGRMNECKKYISDIDDVPLLAVALALNTEGVWTHDTHFNKQKKVRVFTNIDMLKMGEKI